MSAADRSSDGPVAVLEGAEPSAGEAISSASDVARAAPKATTAAPRAAAPARASAADIVAIGSGVALSAGLAESGFWWVRKFVTGELACLPGDLHWMAPVAQLAILAVPILAMVLVTWAGKRISLQVAVTGLSGLAWLNVVLLIPGLQMLAYLLLAGGLAAVTGRLAASHTVAARRIAWRGTLCLALLVAAVATVSGAGHWSAERRMEAALPAARPEAPNVLLLVLDTVRADSVGCIAGKAALTPHIDRFAQRGVVFAHAQSTAPWTLPSHAGMFTSRLPSELTGDWLTPLDDHFPTLAEHLADAGYATAGFVANTRYCSAETGLARGFAHYEGFTHSVGDFTLCTAIGRTLSFGSLPPRFGYDDLPGRKSAAVINAQFLNWQAEHSGRPFFAFLNYWDTHDPYLAPAPYGHTATLTAAQRQMLRNWWWMTKQGLQPADIALARKAHEDCIRYLDAQIGQLLERLKQRGVLENTLVLITSDHGEHFGEHGLLLHGDSLYEPLVHVPLVMAWPGHVPEGQRVSSPVSLGELPATISELTGVGRGPFRGRALQHLWQASPAAAAEPPPALVAEIVSQAKFPPCHGHSPVARGTMRSVRIGSVKYILNGDGQEELYNLAGDPGEADNLAPDPAWAATLDRCRRALAARPPRHERPAVSQPSGSQARPDDLAHRQKSPG